jgi:hypothetical protein
MHAEHDRIASIRRLVGGRIDRRRLVTATTIL